MENGLNGFGETACPSSSNHVLEHVVHNLRNNIPLWEDVVVKGQKLHQNIKATLQTSSAFMDSVQKVADCMTHSPSGLKDVGCNLTRFCVRQRAVEEKTKLFNYQLAESLVNPLQERLEDWRRINTVFEKEKQRDWKRARIELRKAIEDVEKINKKTKKKSAGASLGPETQLQMEFAQQDVTEKQHMCREMERQALEKALVEEKRRYIDFLACLRPLWEHQMGLLQEMERLQETLQALDHYSSDPNDLPAETRNLIDYYEVALPSCLAQQQHQGTFTMSRGATESQHYGTVNSSSNIGFATLQSRRLSVTGLGSFATLNGGGSGDGGSNNCNNTSSGSRVWSVSSGSRSSIASSAAETSSLFSANIANCALTSTNNGNSSHTKSNKLAFNQQVTCTSQCSQDSGFISRDNHQNEPQRYLRTQSSPTQAHCTNTNKCGMLEELSKFGDSTKIQCKEQSSSGSECNSSEDEGSTSDEEEEDVEKSKAPLSATSALPSFNEPVLPQKVAAAVTKPTTCSSFLAQSSGRSNPAQTANCTSNLPQQQPSGNLQHYANTSEIQQRLSARLQAVMEQHYSAPIPRQVTPPRTCPENVPVEFSPTSEESTMTYSEPAATSSSAARTTPASTEVASRSRLAKSQQQTVLSNQKPHLQQNAPEGHPVNLPSAVVRSGIPVLPGHALLRSVSHQQGKGETNVTSASLLSPALLRRMSARDTPTATTLMGRGNGVGSVSSRQNANSSGVTGQQETRKPKPPVSRRSSSLCRGEELRSQIEVPPQTAATELHHSQHHESLASIAHDADMLLSQSRLLSSAMVMGVDGIHSQFHHPYTSGQSPSGASDAAYLVPLHSTSLHQQPASASTSAHPQHKPTLPPKPRFSIDNAMATLKRGAAGMRSLMSQDFFGASREGLSGVNTGDPASQPDLSYLESMDWQGQESTSRSATPSDDLESMRLTNHTNKVRHPSLGSGSGGIYAPVYTGYSFMGLPPGSTGQQQQSHHITKEASDRTLQRTFFT